MDIDRQVSGTPDTPPPIGGAAASSIGGATLGPLHRLAQSRGMGAPALGLNQQTQTEGMEQALARRARER